MPLCLRERPSSAFQKLNRVLFRQFVDLCGEDEIVFGIPANRRRSNVPMDAADDGLGQSTEGEAAASPKGRKAKAEQEEAPALQ